MWFAWLGGRSGCQLGFGPCSLLRDMSRHHFSVVLLICLLLVRLLRCLPKCCTVCLPVRPSVCLPVSLSLSVSLCLSLSLCLSVSLSLSASPSLSVARSVLLGRCFSEHLGCVLFGAPARASNAE